MHFSFLCTFEACGNWPVAKTKDEPNISWPVQFNRKNIGFYSKAKTQRSFDFTQAAKYSTALAVRWASYSNISSKNSCTSSKLQRVRGAICRSRRRRSGRRPVW
ncbi:hypothetical protein CUMW_092620 [Citrus unshiu]|nr:hypothetical protein CUMW_092620 [Citrus unshiu]